MICLHTAVFFCLPLLAFGNYLPPALSDEMLRTFIPSGSDLSRYTVRYLSQASGSVDSEACLQPPSPQVEEPNATVQSCNSTRYSLSGGSDINYLILIVSPARETYSLVKGIELTGFRSIIIAKNPMERAGDANEVIFECEGEHYGIYFKEVGEVNLMGVMFSNCGPGVVISHVETAILDKCTFRYAKVYVLLCLKYRLLPFPCFELHYYNNITNVLISQWPARC